MTQDLEGLGASGLEAEIAALSARMDAAMHRMLHLIRLYDDTGQWGWQGHRSCAAWQVPLPGNSCRFAAVCGADGGVAAPRRCSSIASSPRLALVAASAPVLGTNFRAGVLSWRTGLEIGAARERVRVAHALAELPLIDAALARGELSYSKVRAMTRVATPEREAELLQSASHNLLGRLAGGAAPPAASTLLENAPAFPRRVSLHPRPPRSAILGRRL